MRKTEVHLSGEYGYKYGYGKVHSLSDVARVKVLDMSDGILVEAVEGTPRSSIYRGMTKGQRRTLNTAKDLVRPWAEVKRDLEYRAKRQVANADHRQRKEQQEQNRLAHLEAALAAIGLDPAEAIRAEEETRSRVASGPDGKRRRMSRFGPVEIMAVIKAAARPGALGPTTDERQRLFELVEAFEWEDEQYIDPEPKELPA